VGPVEEREKYYLHQHSAGAGMYLMEGGWARGILVEYELGLRSSRVGWGTV